LSSQKQDNFQKNMAKKSSLNKKEVGHADPSGHLSDLSKEESAFSASLEIVSNSNIIFEKKWERSVAILSLKENQMHGSGGQTAIFGALEGTNQKCRKRKEEGKWKKRQNCGM